MSASTSPLSSAENLADIAVAYLEQLGVPVVFGTDKRPRGAHWPSTKVCYTAQDVYRRFTDGWTHANCDSVLAVLAEHVVIDVDDLRTVGPDLSALLATSTYQYVTRPGHAHFWFPLPDGLRATQSKWKFTGRLAFTGEVKTGPAAVVRLYGPRRDADGVLTGEIQEAPRVGRPSDAPPRLLDLLSRRESSESRPEDVDLSGWLADHDMTDGEQVEAARRTIARFWERVGAGENAYPSMVAAVHRMTTEVTGEVYGSAHLRLLRDAYVSAPGEGLSDPDGRARKFWYAVKGSVAKLGTATGAEAVASARERAERMRELDEMDVDPEVEAWYRAVSLGRRFATADELLRAPDTDEDGAS